VPEGGVPQASALARVRAVSHSAEKGMLLEWTAELVPEHEAIGQGSRGALVLPFGDIG
jgi:hypothetical protein